MDREELEMKLNGHWWHTTDDLSYQWDCPVCGAVVADDKRIKHVEWHVALMKEIKDAHNQ